MPSTLGPLYKQPDNLSLLSTSRFKLDISKLNLVDYFCQQANIPGISIPPAKYPTPKRDLAFTGTKIDFDELTIEFVLDEDLANYRELQTWIISQSDYLDKDWYANLANIKSNGLYSDATLHITTNASNANLKVNFKDIFPVSLSSIVFNTTVDDSSFKTATASFAYSYYEIIKL